ncbi:MAG: UvrD-helicase domain-containing protein [Planctomycetota bacterium]|jgi:hypothetical protein
MKSPEAAVKLNDDQRAALDLGRDLLVVAGAGAGKTEVLGLRILALLEHGQASIQEIVAFTFTKKAAAEMRERVLAKLIERIAELGTQDIERRSNLMRARRDFDKNRITTMHGFCQRLLNDYAWEVELEPNAPLLDERQQRQVQDAAVRRVMLHSDAETEPEVVAALTMLGRVAKPRGISEALRMILRERDVLVPAIDRAASTWEDINEEVSRRRIAHDKLEIGGLQRLRDLLDQVKWSQVEAANAGDDLREIMLGLREAVDTGNGFVYWLDTAKPSILGSSGKAVKHARTGKKPNWDDGTLAPVRDIARQLSACIEEAYGPLLKLLFNEQHERHVGESMRNLGALATRLLEVYDQVPAD